MEKPLPPPDKTEREGIKYLFVDLFTFINNIRKHIMKHITTVVICLLVLAAFAGAFAWSTSRVDQAVKETDRFKQIARMSEYYTKVSRALWGNKAGRCDAGLILIVENLLKENADSSINLTPDREIRLILTLMTVESGFNSYAVSSKSCRGLMQLDLGTAKYHESDVKAEDLFDDVVNIRLGIKEFHHMVNRYNDVEVALLAYNRGPGNVDRSLASDISPRNGYSKMIYAYQMMTTF